MSWGYKTDPKAFFSLLITKDVSLLLNASTKTKVEKTMLKEQVLLSVLEEKTGK